MSRLIQQSEEMKGQASRLLNEGEIVNLLASYGQVTFTGSYELGLMLDPDIDLKVLVPKLNKSDAIEAMTDFIEQGYFLSCHYYDWVQFHKENFPTGYYLGLHRVVDETKWKIDIWFLEKSDPREVELVQRLKQALDDTMRLKILELKNYRNVHKLDVSSAKIYELVLNNQNRSVGELTTLLNS